MVQGLKTMSLRAIWRILQLPCDESTRLMSLSLDEELPLTDRMAFRLHAISCGSCRRFFKQIRFMRAATDRRRLLLEDPSGAAAHDVPALSPEARLRIDRAVRKAGESGE
jgi:Putative zinc-finger